MRKDSTPSGIFDWIKRSCQPKTADAVSLRFERMESQAGRGLPEIHLPLDHRDPSHWHHRGMIWDYVLSLEGAERVLDVGPGDGWPSLLIAKHIKSVTGIEPGPVRLAACKANAVRMRARHAHFELMSACDMSFRPGSFDGVVAATSIEQTPNPTAALSEVFRVLRVGGTFRLTYEALEDVAEPIREAVSIQHGREGAYLVDYVVAWVQKAEERAFLLEVVPLTDGNRKRLELWAKRCADDLFPHRDPRLERGLAQTVKAIRKPEILGAQTFRLRHFKTDPLIRTLKRIGFADIRPITGGGWPARQCCLEMIQARRIESAAPLMEEICRGAARIGIQSTTGRRGQLIMCKPRGGGRPRAATATKKKTTGGKTTAAAKKATTAAGAGMH